MKGGGGQCIFNMVKAAKLLNSGGGDITLFLMSRCQWCLMDWFMVPGTRVREDRQLMGI